MTDVKVFRQQYAMQCGAACLYMITRSYGLNYGLSELESYCRPGKRGVSLLAISNAADKIGLLHSSRRLSIAQLKEHDGPAILYWNQNHFVVYCGCRKDRHFVIADPGKGKYSIGWAELEERWANSQKDGICVGIAMLFDGVKDGVPRAKITSGGTALHLRRFVATYRNHLMVVALALLAVSVLQMILPFTTKIIVDKGIANKDLSLIWMVLAGELAIILGRTVSDFVRRWMMLHISVRVNVDLMSSYLTKLLKLPMSFFDIRLLGDLVQRTSDHYRVQSFLTEQTLNLVFTAINFIVFGVVLSLFNTYIFMVYMCATLVYGIWISIFFKRRKLIDYEYFEKNCVNENITYEFLTNLQETKLQGCGGRRRQQWENSQADLYHTRIKSLKLQQTQEVGSMFINELKNILITVISASSVIDGSMTFGDMIAVEYIVGQLNAPVAQFMSFVFSLQDVSMSLDRINEIHSREDENHGCLEILPKGGKVSVSVRNLSFRYDSGMSTDVIKKMTIDIPAGKTTAIVGLSGSGKSTLLKLLTGYYREYEGEILINGKELRDVDIDEWRDRCGVVMQESVLFSESIARNIAVSDGPADENRIVEAARTAGILDYIMSLPLKFNTVVGNSGKGLSQGQKQRLLIARAVYKNPDFLILDEATNSLDAYNENVIVNNLENFCKDRTVLIVAHRLSTIRNADCILVMENGNIVESGSHQKLLDLQGHYYNLVSKQLEQIQLRAV